MDTVTTSPASGLPAADTLRGEWQALAQFLKRPLLPARAAAPSWAGVRATGRLLVLDMIVMGALTGFAGVLVLLGLELPDNELASMDITMQFVALVVLFAPVSEELLFRGWLSGRPGHVLGVLLFALGLGAIPFAMGITEGQGSDPHIAPIVAGGSLMLLAIAALFAFRKRPAWRWFAWTFPALFWLATLAFALVHLLNFTEGSLIFLLPFVIPQFILGAILGYVRVHYGLWAAIALHMAHNGLLVGIVALAMQAGAEI